VGECVVITLVDLRAKDDAEPVEVGNQGRDHAPEARATVRRHHVRQGPGDQSMDDRVEDDITVLSSARARLIMPDLAQETPSKYPVSRCCMPMAADASGPSGPWARQAFSVYLGDLGWTSRARGNRPAPPVCQAGEIGGD